MAEEQPGKSVWLQIVISCLLTALLSILGTVLVFYYTKASPILRYTIFPFSLYKAENRNLSIYNAQIENSGNKEAEDVNVSFYFPKNSIPSDYNLELSSKIIKYRMDTTDKTNALKDAVFHFPLLNPKESIKFSFLTEDLPTEGEKQNIRVELRAKGVVGEEREIIADREKIPLFLIISFPVVAAVLLFLTFILYTRLRRLLELLTGIVRKNDKSG